MKRTNKFSKAVAEEIRQVLHKLRDGLVDRATQKKHRRRLRNRGLYIEDYGKGMTVNDFDHLVRTGTITVY